MGKGIDCLRRNGLPRPMDFSDPYHDLDVPENSVGDELDAPYFDEFDDAERGSDPPRQRREPARRRTPRRSGDGGGGDRRQLLMRRGLALGLGLVILLLLVLGAKGCLDARKNRSLENYASSVSQIVTETNTLGKSFTDRLASPGDLSVTEFTSEVESDRGAMDGFLSRVQKLSTPGDMKSAQQTLETEYQLRAKALGAIANQMSTALGDEGREKAIARIAKQINVLGAADVLYNEVTRPEIDDTIASSGANAAELPAGNFISEPARWINTSTLTSALSLVAGGTTAAADGGVHGTGLISVSIGGVTLDPDVATVIPAGTDPTVEVQVQNQGEAEESGLTVSVTADGNTLDGTIATIGSGETATASIPLTPAPSGEVSLEIKVASVPGEQVLDNNEASYTVDFK